MLMKQHSYAFYNGHLSTVFKRRRELLRKIKLLEGVVPVTAPSDISLEHLDTPDVDRIVAAIDAREPLDEEQLLAYERAIKWEVDALSD